VRKWLLVGVLLGCGGPAPMPTPNGEGESCMKPFRFVDRALSFSGTTAGFQDDEGPDRSPCGGGGAGDLVFELPATGGALVTITVTGSADFQPIVKVRGFDRGCIAQDEQCDSATGKGKAAELVDWSPARSGHQYVIVDGQNQTSGAFTLTVSQR
jgi:hypothetical protein